MHVSYKSFRGDKSDGFGTSILLGAGGGFGAGGGEGRVGRGRKAVEHGAKMSGDGTFIP